MIIFLFLCLLFGCNSSSTEFEAWMKESGKIKVLSTTAMIDDLVGQIGKERIDHIPLIIGEIDPHAYELVKGDEEKLSFAKIIFFNGLGLEHGASLRYRLEMHPHAVAVGDLIYQKYPDLILKKEGQLDPHIWMDISLWVEAIDPIVQALAKEDPEYGEFYQRNGEALRQTLLKTHETVMQKMHSISPNKRFLVTSHDAFHYFVRRYLAETEEDWKCRFAAPEGLAPEGQLSARDIQKIIEYLQKYQITTVFPESNVSRDSLKKIVQVSSELGMKVTLAKQFLYGDAMGASSSYLNMMLHNAEVLIDEWK